ncbi:NAD-dependent epimerase/dehydratase family protein [Selenomonas sp. GACV-9]|uniref:NAD-dependent epimerase/dehydratase family protein n=1 Tax=Selenomonas sp. GACV-9 TaxID=3158782 RepID=UPI0015A63BBA
MAKRIILAGDKPFWQQELQHIFIKEGWQVFEWEKGQAGAAEIVRIHNIPVLLYAIGAESADSKTGCDCQELLTVLQACRENGVRQVYLLSSLLSQPLAGQREPASLAAALAERIGSSWAEVSGCRFMILRLPEVYGPGCQAQDGFMGRSLYALLQGGMVASRTAGRRSFIYRDDAVYGIYRAVSRQYSGAPLSLTAGNGLGWEELPRLLQQVTGRTCPMDIMAEAADSYAMNTSGENVAEQELGWREKYTLPEGLRLTWEYVQASLVKEKEASAAARQQAKRQLRWQKAVPYIENAAGCCLMAAVMAFQQGTPVNPVINFDINYVYIGAMGWLYGKHQALLAMVLSTVLLFVGLVWQGNTWVGLLYVPAVLIHVSMYLFVAVLTGYVADSRKHEREAADWQVAQYKERVEFFKKLYEENLEVKDHLYHQIVNSDDSIGRLYRIIRNLDSVELENIFTQAAAVTAQVLDVQDIAIYVVGADQRYLRQKVRMGRLANQQPRSLCVADSPYLQTVLREKAIYINRELVKDTPDMAAPIVHQGQVIAVIEIFGMKFEQWSLYQQNLLSITVRLIASSMGRAYQYESEIQQRRYMADTRIMQEDEFRKIIEELRARRKLQGDLPIAMLRVDMTGMDYRGLDERLTGVIRNEDFVGLLAGNIYVLLPDADEEVTAMVQRRLQKRGLATWADEGIV